jgi:hypothetical protein
MVKVLKPSDSDTKLSFFFSENTLRPITEINRLLLIMETHVEASGTYRNVCTFKMLVNLSMNRLVVRVPGYRSRGPGSIPAATRFSEK